MASTIASLTALNAICPYFTMFPLEFPRGILNRYARRGQRVLDPFCGRGTTNFAARLAGLESLGIDSSPVAAAITAAKVATASVSSVMRAAHTILNEVPTARIPRGDFWDLAYHADVLNILCRLRKGLVANCSSDSRRVLRGIILGALHGPLSKGESPSYLSNQCTRTYAPKPGYAVKYWDTRQLMPPQLNPLRVIRRRATRYLSSPMPIGRGESLMGDSRLPIAPLAKPMGAKFDWVITSPPYYGMRTYIQDQWLRNWFVGGPSVVDYTVRRQLSHLSAHAFSLDLANVWDNVADVCKPGATLVIRFGGIRDRNLDPLEIVKHSLRCSGWHVFTVREAGSADAGRRQADSFLKKRYEPMAEYDIWARLA